MLSRGWNLAGDEICGARFRMACFCLALLTDLQTSLNRHDFLTSVLIDRYRRQADYRKIDPPSEHNRSSGVPRAIFAHSLATWRHNRNMLIKQSVLRWNQKTLKGYIFCSQIAEFLFTTQCPQTRPISLRLSASEDVGFVSRTRVGQAVFKGLCH